MCVEVSSFMTRSTLFFKKTVCFDVKQGENKLQAAQ